MNVKQLIREGHVVYRLFDYTLYKLGLITHKVYSLNWDNYCYKRLTERVEAFLPNVLPIANKREKGDTIWWCWLQGLNEAPELVKACYRQTCIVCKNQYNVVVIDKDNFLNYVSLPQDIIDSWRCGKIGNAHFSDLLRIELLIEHGGVWIDATAYLTDTIPEYVVNSDLFLFRTNLFVYSYPLELDEDGIIANNWFIAAKNDDPFLILMRDYLFEYWRKGEQSHYYIWHLAFSAIAKKYPEYWKRVPLGCDISTNYLIELLDKPFDELLWENVKDLSWIHKLSWKKDLSVAGEDSFYKKIIRNELK